MGLELARAWIRVRADASSLTGDFSNAQKIAIDQSRKISNTINQTIHQHMAKGGGLFGGLFKKLAMLGTGFGVGALTKQMFSLAGSMEETTMSMTVMLGSATKARDVINQIRELSLKSPFSFEELASNTRLLLAYGIASKDLVDTTKALGNISAAAGADFGRLALAYGQVQSKGRLQAQEIRQFTEATVPLVQILAEQMGKSTSEILKLVEEGAVGFSEVKKAIFGLSEDGGRYADMMLKMSTTMKGSFQVLKNYIHFVMTDIGTALLPVMKGLINIVSKLGEKLRNLFDTKAKGPLTAWAQNVGDVLNTIANNIQLVWDLWQAQAAVNRQWLAENWKILFTNTIPTYAKAGALAIYEIFKGLANAIAALMSGDWFQEKVELAKFHASKAWTPRAEVYYQDYMRRNKIDPKTLSESRRQQIYSEVENRAYNEMLKQIKDRYAEQRDSGAMPAIKSAFEEADKVYQKELKKLKPFEESPELKKLKMERDALAAKLNAALEEQRKARKAAENAPDQNRPELLPDTGQPESKKKKGGADRIVGIAELGKKIQQQMLDEDAKRQEKIIKLQTENNAQNKTVIGLMEKTLNKWDKLPDLGALV